MIEICDRTLCTGCCACMNICGKKAISMKLDALGFEYPFIDESLCVDCGLCSKICPVNQPPKAIYPSEVYAVQSADLRDLMSSTSGGAASVFSQYVLQQGGIVYGCSGEDIFRICHKRVDSLSDLSQLKGSKYVQSKIGTTFKLLKEDLLSGKNVLFIGTPCQVAGLKNFLRVEYEKLVTVDLVCHGVPSQQLLLENIKKPEQDLRNCLVAFRKKGEKESDLKYGVYVKRINSLIYSKDYPQDYYIMGFMRGLFHRNSCYSCRWASPERCSEITIGDFWGLGEVSNKQIEKGRGVSEVLLNNEKGKAFFDSCKKLCQYEKREVQEAIEGNGQLQFPSSRHPLYYEFQQLYMKDGFNKSCRRCLRDDYLHYYTSCLRKNIVFLLDKIPYTRKSYQKIKKMLRLCLKR